MKKKIIIGVSIALGIIYIIGMFLLSKDSFELVHIIFEVYALLLGSAIFLTVVISMKIKQTMYISIIAPGIFIATVLSFMHALASEDLDLFVTDVSDLPFLLLTLSTYVIAISFVLGGFLLNRKYNLLISVVVFFSIGLVVSVLAFGGYLPKTIIDGNFTQFKYISDYIILGLYLISLILIYKNKSFLTKRHLNYFSLAISIFFLSTIINLFLPNYQDNENFFRILLKIVGLAILYIPILEKNIKNPFNELVKNLSYENELNKNTKNKMFLILDSVEEGIYGVDLEDRCTFVNDSFLKMLKFDNRKEVIGKQMHELIHHSNQDGSVMLKENCTINTARKEGDSIRLSGDIAWTKSGEMIHVEYSSKSLIENDEIIGNVVSFKDASEKLMYNKSLIKLSYFDYLTELHNRRYFELEIEKLDIQENYPFTIIIADLNGLKFINDSFGHEYGDEFLIKASSIMKKECNDNCILARMGGDEFVLAMPNMSVFEAEKLIKLIETKISNEYINSIQLSVSFGYATKNSEGTNIEEMYKKAENSLYQNKLLKQNSKRSNVTDTILATLFEKDIYSESHSRSVSLLSEKIAKYYGMALQEITEIKTAGLLHDIGKIIIPTEILNKKGILTDYEYNEIKKHPEIGFRILNSTRNMHEISRIVLYHHERWDGKGYPKGMSGKDIPLQSRIISLADAFDAMTSDRTYKEKMSNEQALFEIKRNSSTQFDPELVKVFEEYFVEITAK